MKEELKISRDTIGRAVVLRLSGDLTTTSGDTLLRLYDWEKGLGDGASYLVLNLREVPYINSSGIALLIRIARAGRKGGYRVFACGLSPHYEKLFGMVGLTEFLMIYPDEYSVLQRLELEREER